MRLMNRIAFTLMLASLLPSQLVEAALTACAVPSKDGDLNITATNAVVNSYFPGTGNPVQGATSITIGALDTRGGTTPITAGDLLLIVQVQGATSNAANSASYGASNGTGRGYSNQAIAGDYEYVRANNTVGSGGGTLNLTSPITNGYQTGSPGTGTGAGVIGRRRFQIIRVPQYRNLTLTGSVTAPVWNGDTGGIVAFDVANDLAISGMSINVTGKGFRGGGGIAATTGAAWASRTVPDYATNQATNAAHGQKGESITGTPYRAFDGNAVTTLTANQMPGSRNAARGAPGNGGGGGTDGNPTSNDENAGGGGGANGGTGGQGGYSWCTTFNNTLANRGCFQSGGVGGQAVPNSGKDSLILGGGGGAGSNNNDTGNLANGGSSSGAPGGGAVLVRAGRITGTGSFVANGGTFSTGVSNDATGGGGAGGTVQVFTLANAGSLTVTAQGGAGMSNTGGGSSHGPGGGGSGGQIVSNFTISSSVTGGAAGTTFSSASYGVNYGATAGAAGTVDTTYASTSIPGRYYSGAECSPTVTKTFGPDQIPVGGTSRLTIGITNPNPTLAISYMSLADAFPTGMINSAIPAGATTCTSGTVTAAAGANAANLSGAGLAANSSCTYSVNISSNATGSYVNTIPAGAIVATMGGSNVTNPQAATDTLTVTQGLTITKSSRTMYDPANNFTNPKAIPGALVQYSLTVRNPSNLTITADSVVLSDVVPANTQLLTYNAYAAYGYPNARGPFQYNDGQDGSGVAGTASGLTFTYAGLADANDSSSFSSDGTSYAYSPSVNGNLVDPNVKAVQFRMFGTMAPNSVFTVNFLVRIN